MMMINCHVEDKGFKLDMVVEGDTFDVKCSGSLSGLSNIVASFPSVLSILNAKVAPSVPTAPIPFNLETIGPIRGKI